MNANKGKSEKQVRAERLAAALRANLRKRKGLGGDADPAMDRHPPQPGGPEAD